MNRFDYVSVSKYARRGLCCYCCCWSALANYTISMQPTRKKMDNQLKFIFNLRFVDEMGEKKKSGFDSPISLQMCFFSYFHGHTFHSCIILALDGCECFVFCASDKLRDASVSSSLPVLCVCVCVLVRWARTRSFRMYAHARRLSVFRCVLYIFVYYMKVLQSRK